MVLTDCLRRTPHRHYLAWVAWFEMDLNRAGKTEWYIAQLTAETAKAPARVWGREPTSINPNLYIMPFVRKTVSVESESGEITDGPPLVTKEDIVSIHKQQALLQIQGVKLKG